MPKTKLQNFIFTSMMAFLMVYAMICYNIAIATGGMTNQVFIMAFQETIVMWPIAIILELFVVEKIAQSLTFRLVDSQADHLFHITIILCSMIVCLMCPMMSFIATFLFKNAGIHFIAVWLQTTVINFPMALGWQIFFAGPLIRKIFRQIFVNE